FNCSCCPTNVVRVFPSLSGYIYAQTAETLYVNLFIASQTTVTVHETAVQLTQQTNYPWDGKIRVLVQPAKALDFTLSLRIPGWAQSAPVPSGLYYYFSMPSERALITVNGDSVDFTVEQGYARLTRTWQPGDVVELTLPMEIKRVMSHVNVRENDDKVAIERGPLVYCAEAVDNNGAVLATPLTDDAVLTAVDRPDLLNGITVIQAQQAGGNITLIPYYAWAHRGIGEMTVWFNR
ncbi:MAG: glycoside hydrolase family 127 protein, partial [Caldilineaceae bacterium]|nr:glycoside hydrolase family 127 protein [Caldilineaceae bacterium]